MSQYTMPKPTQLPANQQVSVSSLETDGGLGSWMRAGRQMAGISLGLKQSASNSSPPHSQSLGPRPKHPLSREVPQAWSRAGIHPLLHSKVVYVLVVVSP